MAENLSAQAIVNLIRKKKAVYWNRKRKERMLELFRLASRRVPAYKDFLKKHKVNPAKIKTLSDFQSLPTIGKKNYLHKYPLKKLCWDGTLEKPIVFTSTSGSTGKPTYFPRGYELDWEYSVLAQLFLENSSYSKKGPTLVVIGFGMGVWIGGLITYQAFEIAGRRVKSTSIITPGINKKEIFNALKELAPRYEEVILVGYPPFVKDIIDEASHHGVNLKRLNIRILCAAEAFTEKFRDYLTKKAGIGSPYLDTLNIYGTADIGAMAWESPTTILLRRLALKKKKLFRDMFTHASKTPTLAQYNPLFVNFEEQDGEILITGDNTIPLIRYVVGDHGGAMGFNEAEKIYKKHGTSIRQAARKAGIGKYVYELPLVYVYERADLSTTLYGLQIYPEHIREALIDASLSGYVTGRFTLITRFDEKQNQYLEINIELRKNKKVNAALKKRTLDQIVTQLLVKNSEFRELYEYLGKRALPKLVFWPAEHKEHFTPGIKQKWVKR